MDIDSQNFYTDILSRGFGNYIVFEGQDCQTD